MTIKVKKQKPFAGDPIIFNVNDGSRCRVNDCLDKFVEIVKKRTVIISTAYRAGGPLMEITYDYYEHECPCGNKMLFDTDIKKNKKSLFGKVDSIYEDIQKGIKTWENDLEEFQCDRGTCFRLKNG